MQSKGWVSHHCRCSSSNILSLQQILTGNTSSGKVGAFQANHIQTDVRLALGFASSFAIIGVSVWSYFIETDWSKNKTLTLYCVLFYALASGLQALSSYVQGTAIFDGTRTTPEGSAERLIISSAKELPKPTLLPGTSAEARTTRLIPGTSLTNSTGDRPVCVPPAYALSFDYTKTSSSGQSVKKSSGSGKDAFSKTAVTKAGKQEAQTNAISLGHLGEWFTEEGEFRQDIFEERLRGVVAKVIE